jgi:hypothetical protein
MIITRLPGFALMPGLKTVWNKEMTATIIGNAIRK